MRITGTTVIPAGARLTLDEHLTSGTYGPPAIVDPARRRLPPLTV